jgi:hypothetical protein
MRRTLVLTALVATASTTCAAARVSATYDADRSPFPIPMIESHVVVDGVVGEAAWEDALELALEYEQRPGENCEPPVTTTVLLVHDRSHVFAAFICDDPDPGSIRAQYTDRDRIWSDDWVLLVLDTFNSGREACNFACNPLGIQGDTYESPNGESDAWDAIWDSAGRITDDGYVVEMAIPFSSLRFQRTDGEQIWGFDVARSYPRNVGYRFGFFPVDRDNECYACQYSKLVGFAGASPGRNIEIDPTVTALATQERSGWTAGSFGDPESEFEAGVTGSWGFTPNVTLTATGNPDFSQVEADARQLDVNTKYALYYNEKRPFFLEGADIFSDRLNTVYTRTAADPSWGLKLTGRQGGHLVGAFVTRDEITNLIIPGTEGSCQTSLDTETTASAIRYRLDVGRASGVGVLATNREGDGYYNRTAGMDGFLRFLKSERIDFQVLGTWTKYPESIVDAFAQPEGELRDTGYDLGYTHRSENVNWYAHHRNIGDDYRSDVGFRPHVGEKHVCTGIARNWRREAGSWYTLVEVGVTHSQNLFQDGDLQSRGTGIFVDYAGPLQSRVYLSPELTREVYDGKEYDLAGLFALGELRPGKSVLCSWEAGVGDGIDYDNNRKGKALWLKPAVRLLLGRHVDVVLSHDYSQLDVGGERLYTTNISYLKTVYQFTSRAFLRAIFQRVDYAFSPELYSDPVSERETWLAGQLLFSYKINPHTVFYIGYSDGYYGDDDVKLTQTDRAVFAKMGYAFVL